MRHRIRIPIELMARRYAAHMTKLNENFSILRVPNRIAKLEKPNSMKYIYVVFQNSGVIRYLYRVFVLRLFLTIY